MSVAASGGIGRCGGSTDDCACPVARSTVLADTPSSCGCTASDADGTAAASRCGTWDVTAVWRRFSWEVAAAAAAPSLATSVAVVESGGCTRLCHHAAMVVVSVGLSLPPSPLLCAAALRRRIAITATAADTTRTAATVATAITTPLLPAPALPLPPVIRLSSAGGDVVTDGDGSADADAEDDVSLPVLDE